MTARTSGLFAKTTLAGFLFHLCGPWPFLFDPTVLSFDRSHLPVRLILSFLRHTVPEALNAIVRGSFNVIRVATSSNFGPLCGTLFSPLFSFLHHILSFTNLLWPRPTEVKQKSRKGGLCKKTRGPGGQEEVSTVQIYMGRSQRLRSTWGGLNG